MSTITFMFGSTVVSSAGDHFAVGRQGLDSKPVFAVMRRPKGERRMVGKCLLLDRQ